ncbi:MAG TPA: hypothetical protein VF950_04360 [Planctomycetota bacterium]
MAMPEGRRSSKPSTVRRKTTRRDPDSADDRAAQMHAASEERKAKSQMALIGGIGGGGLLLLIIIIAAASSGSARPDRRTEKKAAAPPPPVEAPVAKPKPTNYVRNTGAIVFVCGGIEAHPDKEVVIPSCPKCSAKNVFEVDNEARAYRCTKCKGVYENADIKCGDCGRAARVTHLKKILATAQ